MARLLFVMIVMLFFVAESHFAFGNGLLFGSKKTRSNQLPTPSGLEADVNFWEQVFDRVPGNKCIFHDSKNLDVVYFVKKLPRGRKAQRRAIKNSKRAIIATLNSLAKGKKLQTKLSRRLAQNIPKRLHKRAFFLKARHRVRCQKGVADSFAKSLKRSKLYLPMIRRLLRKRGLPLDLAYLPHLESGFNAKAHSKVGARGLWQIMPRTARGFLKVNRRRDDRLNVNLSSKFAVKMLHENYRKVGSWPLAVTGYNYGINGIHRAIKRLGTKDYMKIRKRHRSRIFGFAAKNFYPSFLAVRNLARKHEQGH